jgi:hypothetical protein
VKEKCLGQTKGIVGEPRKPLEAHTLNSHDYGIITNQYHIPLGAVAAVILVLRIRKRDQD